MVLGDLGRKISGALRSMATSTVIDETVLKECLTEIARALLQADVQAKIVMQLRNNVMTAVKLEENAAGINKRRVIERAVFNELVKMLDPGVAPFRPKKGKTNVVMFVGLQGSGKTTTCTKYASYYRRKGWKTAGAFDQLKQNATKARIDYYGSYTETDPVRIAQDGVENFKAQKFDLVIVDTSGRHHQDAELFEEMRQISSVVEPDDTIFTLDASIGQAAYEHALAFNKAVGVGSVIVTKMDGAKGGGALAAVSATHAPIGFIGTGEHTDDFETFDAKVFVQKLLGLGDIGGLINVIKDAGLDQQEALVQNLMQGIFTLRDMRDQFNNLLKMGPLSQIMGMLPGMSQDLIPKGSEKEGMKRIKGFLCMMDSMTDQELDNPKLFFSSPSRVARVARGSGHSLRQVNDMLEEHKRLGKMFSKMKNMKIPKNGQMDMSRQNMQQMARMMDPAMLQRMGGISGMQSMMKQMSGSGQFPPGMGF